MFLRTLRKVKAMPPPMIISSTLSSMLLISWILSLTLALWRWQTSTYVRLVSVIDILHWSKSVMRVWMTKQTSRDFCMHCLNGLSKEAILFREASNQEEARERKCRCHHCKLRTADEQEWTLSTKKHGYGEEPRYRDFSAGWICFPRSSKLP